MHLIYTLPVHVYVSNFYFQVLNSTLKTILTAGFD